MATITDNLAEFGRLAQLVEEQVKDLPTFNEISITLWLSAQAISIRAQIAQGIADASNLIGQFQAAVDKKIIAPAYTASGFFSSALQAIGLKSETDPETAQRYAAKITDGWDDLRLAWEDTIREGQNIARGAPIDAMEPIPDFYTFYGDQSTDARLFRQAHDMPSVPPTPTTWLISARAQIFSYLGQMTTAARPEATAGSIAADAAKNFQENAKKWSGKVLFALAFLAAAIIYSKSR